MKLTTKLIENLRPGPVRREIPDAHMPGLYLVLQPTGARAWAVRYRAAGRTRKHTIGSWPAIELATARRLAAAAMRSVAEGRDPGHAKVEARERATGAINSVINEFLDRHVRRNCRPRTIAERERQFRNHVVPQWRGRVIDTITRRDVVRLLDEVMDAGPVAANRLRSTLTTFFGWCVARDIVTASPMIGVRSPAVERSRDRVLSDGELAMIWRAADRIGFPVGPVVKLLILSGQRRSEVAGMQWAELDLERAVWTIPATRVKNRREHVVPLAPAAMEIIKAVPRVYSPGVFTGGGKGVIDFAGGKRAIDAMLPASTPRWTLHDLRRTCVTRMVDIGVQPHVVEAVINHVSGHKGGVAGIYNRSTYAPEKAMALARWAAHVEQIISGDAVIVPLARRK
jgi:integrase